LRNTTNTSKRRRKPPYWEKGAPIERKELPLRDKTPLKGGIID